MKRFRPASLIAFPEREAALRRARDFYALTPRTA